MTAAGTPCQQPINPRLGACVGHRSSPEQPRLLSGKGNLASRMKHPLPSTYQVPEFADEDSILAFARELVHLALTQDVEPRRVDSAIRGAQLALSAISAKTQA